MIEMRWAFVLNPVDMLWVSASLSSGCIDPPLNVKDTQALALRQAILI
jgi:hypothetical protein